MIAGWDKRSRWSIKERMRENYTVQRMAAKYGTVF
jgi:hypothetical protein